MYVVFISPLSFRFHVRCEELCSAECRVQSECRAEKECKYIYIYSLGIIHATTWVYSRKYTVYTQQISEWENRNASVDCCLSSYQHNGILWWSTMMEITRASISVCVSLRHVVTCTSQTDVLCFTGATIHGHRTVEALPPIFPCAMKKHTK